MTALIRFKDDRKEKHNSIEATINFDPISAHNGFASIGECVAWGATEHEAKEELLIGLNKLRGQITDAIQQAQREWASTGRVSR